jgi:hypothetical protein
MKQGIFFAQAYAKLVALIDIRIFDSLSTLLPSGQSQESSFMKSQEPSKHFQLPDSRSSYPVFNLNIHPWQETVRDEHVPLCTTNKIV